MAGEWHTVALGKHVLKIGSGATPRGGAEVYLDEGPFALIRSQNVLDFQFKHAGLAFINREQAQLLDGVSVQEKDILLNITGDSVARICMVDPSILPARVNQHVAIIRVDSEHFEQSFLFYVLASPAWKQLLLKIAGSGATRNALTKGDIERIAVPKPPLYEQRAIANILGSLDEKIDLNRHLMATMEEIARARFKSWFVDFAPVHAKAQGASSGLPIEVDATFPDKFGDDGLPNGWVISTVAGGCRAIFSGGTPSTTKTEFWDGTLPWFSSGETRNRFVSKTEKKITQEAVDNSSTRLARRGSTVIASAGQGNTRGQTSFLLVDTYINQSVVTLQSDNRVSTDLFLFFDLERRYDEFRRVSDGQSSRGSLTTKLIGMLPAVRPNINTIAAFDHATQPLIDRIESLLTQNENLRLLRDTLLPKLVSGEIRIKDAESAIEAA